jgi:hypothetical protein
VGTPRDTEFMKALGIGISLLGGPVGEPEGGLLPGVFDS